MYMPGGNTCWKDYVPPKQERAVGNNLPGDLEHLARRRAASNIPGHSLHPAHNLSDPRHFPDDSRSSGAKGWKLSKLLGEGDEIDRHIAIADRLDLLAAENSVLYA